MKTIYLTNRNVTSNVTEFSCFSSSHLKSIREDFNDMFFAEAQARKERGDMSLVFVLTYDDEHLFTRYGKNLLDANNLAIYSKSSAFSKFLLRAYGIKFDYLSIGEYGNGGESHNFVGVRGKGENPHFHCVGWFQRVAEPDPEAIRRGLEKRGLSELVNKPLYDQLCALVRWNWQQNLENDPHKFGRDKAARRKGIGYVKLDGPIRSSAGGSAYISKYMGKSVQECYTQLYDANFVPNFLRYARIYWRLAVDDMSFEDFISVWLDSAILDSELKSFGVSRLCEYVKHKPLELWYAYKNSTQLSELDTLYRYYYGIFYTNVYSRHSPKLRKFRGFGYVLIHRASMSTGLYTITKKDGVVQRILPPSLIRHFFYDYHVSVNHRGDKVVRYTLNKYGVDLLTYRANCSIEKSLQLVQAKGSNSLKASALRVVLFNVCLRNYDIQHENNSSAYADIYSVVKTLLTSKTASVGWFVSSHTFMYEPFIVPDKRSFVDILEVVRIYEPELYHLSEELRDLMRNKMITKDSKDKEFLDNWHKIYKKTY